MVFDPVEEADSDRLKVVWESHDPTKGRRQGNEGGSQDRTGSYTEDEQQVAQAELARMQ